MQSASPAIIRLSATNNSRSGRYNRPYGRLSAPTFHWCLINGIGPPGDMIRPLMYGTALVWWTPYTKVINQCKYPRAAGRCGFCRIVGGRGSTVEVTRRYMPPSTIQVFAELSSIIIGMPGSLVEC